MIPGERMDFCPSLLMLGTGCVCEGVRGHLQPALCLYMPCSGFSPFPPIVAFFPFLAKYLCPVQGKSSGFWRPVSYRQECLGTRGFPLGKQMFLQQLRFAKSFPRIGGAGGVGEASGVISNACPPCPPILGVIWVSRSCHVTSSPGLVQILEGEKLRHEGTSLGKCWWSSQTVALSNA